MRRCLAVLLLAAAALPPAHASAVLTEEVAFAVTNPLDPGATHTVRGTMYRPAGGQACASSVLLLTHGLSYGRWAWDLTVGDATYSVARALAERGYPSVAIDKLGYGASDKPNGRTLTVQSYAAMTRQMIDQLRAGTYQASSPSSFGRVGLIGHSAGTEISELTAGYFGGIDALVATGYTHFPSQRIVTDFVTGDVVRAFQGESEYFGGTPEQRAEYMYNLDYADPAVVAEDTARAHPTPSGEIHSIGSQPSRQAVEAITAPVLLVLAERDLLFPIEYADEELALFVSSADRSLHVVPTAGHSFMLHPNFSATNEAVGDWLAARPSAIPAC